MTWVGNAVRAQIAFDAPFTLIPTWNTFDAQEIAWGYSREGGPTGQCSPSWARITVDNQDGRWDPSTGLGGSPWASAIERWLQVRVITSTDSFGSSVPRFRGHIVDVVCYETDTDATAVIHCVDMLGVLAEFNLESVVRPAELTGTRVSAIFDEAGFPGLFSFREDSGTVVMPAATLNGQALSLAQECARAEGGHLWCTQNGLPAFTNRFYFYGTATLNAFGLVDDDIEEAQIPKSLQAFSNVAVGSAAGETGTVFKFGAPASLYPSSERREVDLPAIFDADAEATAEWVQRHSNFSGSRVSQVVLSVAHGSDTTVLAGIVGLTLKWLDTVRVQYTPPHGVAVDQTCWVESEEHSASALTGRWTVTLGLSPYETDYKNRSDEFLSFGETMASGQVFGV